ncbi:MAG: glycolate oxidase subunit GlcE [Gammaproteobacteria bacterium]
MDVSLDLQNRLSLALENKQPVAITAGQSKSFYGREIRGDKLSVSAHTGVVDYDFRELVVTVRSGTSLLELQKVLSERNQMLPFEPPVYTGMDTIGGVLACGFSGPGRAYDGSARDFVLGCTLLNGKAEQLKFGGRVMKNVAGYDVSRLMTGAMGTLGMLLDVSLKVLPKPETEKTLIIEKPLNDSIEFINSLDTQRLPITASAYHENRLYLRLSGLESTLDHYLNKLQADSVETDSHFWQQLKDQQLDFFKTDKTLWRFSLPPSTSPLDLNGSTLYEWRGAQRWFIAEDNEISSEEILRVVNQAGGHATQFKNGDRQGEVFNTLPDVLKKYHIKLKQAMDPHGILNPGRLFSFL